MQEQAVDLTNSERARTRTWTTSQGHSSVTLSANLSDKTHKIRTIAAHASSLYTRGGTNARVNE